MDQPSLPPYKALRDVTGLSQREVERRLEWNTGRLSTIERGLIPTPAERQALLRLYNDWLTASLASEATA